MRKKEATSTGLCLERRGQEPIIISENKERRRGAKKMANLKIQENKSRKQALKVKEENKELKANTSWKLEHFNAGIMKEVINSESQGH